MKIIGFFFSVSLAVFCAGPVLAQPASPTGNATRGKLVFLQCQGCHAVQANGPALVGPNLAGAYGRKAGTLAGYSYSDSLKRSGFVWNAASLNSWLINPSAMVPGTKMAFVGLPDPALRADVIAYLAQQK